MRVYSVKRSRRDAPPHDLAIPAIGYSRKMAKITVNRKRSVNGIFARGVPFARRVIDSRGIRPAPSNFPPHRQEFLRARHTQRLAIEPGEFREGGLDRVAGG